MPRVKRSVASRKRRRKVLDQAKGYWGLKKSSYRYAKEQVDHSLTYAYRDRKNKKRTFRRLWIARSTRPPARMGFRTTSSSPA
jgi:large subunit ribosomal protein L20